MIAFGRDLSDDRPHRRAGAAGGRPRLAPRPIPPSSRSRRRAVPGGRTDRRHGAHHLGAARRGARPEHRDREQGRRRRRQHRRQVRRDRRSRRLHHPDDAGRLADHRSGRAHQHRLRPGQGVHAGRLAHRARRSVMSVHPDAAGEDAGRARGLRQGQSRQARSGARRASAPLRTCSPKCSSSKPASTSCTCPIAVRRPMLAAIWPARSRSSPTPAPRCLPHIQAGKLRAMAVADGAARSETAGRADHGRGRLSEAARAVLARRGGAGRHAARHRQQAQRRVPREPERRRRRARGSPTSAPRSRSARRPSSARCSPTSLRGGPRGREGANIRGGLKRAKQASKALTASMNSLVDGSCVMAALSAQVRRTPRIRPEPIQTGRSR